MVNGSCKPTRAHPRPVVLVHGTFADMADSWQALSPLLVDNGYCVFALNYGSSNGSGELGVYATGPIATSAEELGAFVQKVLSATGAGQVDMVGHSQGGMMPRYYLRFLDPFNDAALVVGKLCSARRQQNALTAAIKEHGALRRAGRHIDDAVLAHIWPTHHENIHFYGTHSVDVDGELAKLDADGYRPLRTATATEAS